MVSKVPLLLIPNKIGEKLARPLYSVGKKISNLIPGIKYDLVEADLDYKPANYVAVSLLNALFFFVLFFILLFVLNKNVQGLDIYEALSKASLYSLLIFALALFSLIRYPKIIAGKKAEQVDRNLIFALKDLQLQIRSGVPLYNALVNISKAGYGMASEEFRKVSQDINVGIPINKALEKMATHSKSEFLRRTSWQLINTLKAGASLEEALRALIEDLVVDRRDRIKSYIAELNLLVLLYMLFAVAIPSIGATLLVILSSFAGFGISKEFFVIFIGITLLIQFVLITFMKSRRPVVQV